MVQFYTGSKPNIASGRILETLWNSLAIRIDDFASLDAERRSKDPFRTLIMTVLTQNSTDKAAVKAFGRLDATVGISPGKLAKADVARIKRAIAVGGLQHRKALSLKRLSAMILKRYNGDLRMILREPFDEAREMLMALPGVGPKTADVLLVTAGHKPTIPVDTHVDRVSRRLGLTPLKGGYEKVRASLQSLYSPRLYHRVHLLLIAHGRRYCTARRPRCPQCPVRRYCPYPYKTIGIWLDDGAARRVLNRKVSSPIKPHSPASGHGKPLVRYPIPAKKAA